MRFLLDQNRSPKLGQLLREAGHDAVHTLDLQMEKAEDDELLLLARDQSRVIITGDTDFGALLALGNEKSPSVILFRRRSARSAQHQAELLLEYLDDFADDLNQGAIVVITDQRIRIRRLPLLPDT